jgi:AAA domain
MLVEGDPGTGKTGGLVSLVEAGYWLGILDLDNGLDSLKAQILHRCPEKIGNVEYRTLRDKRKATPDGSIIDGVPRAFVDALKMLDRWKYKVDEDEVDHGVPATWGPDRILVIDSLTLLGDAAYDFREPLVARSRDGKYDKRAVYWDAQRAVENVLAHVTSEWFKTNVIINTHIRYVDNEDGTRKGYPTAIGSALSPQIPRYFNSVALCRSKSGGKRVIQTAQTSLIDLKNPKPFAMLPEYPIETGLADFFAVLREPPEKKDERRPDTRRAASPPSVQSVKRRLG